MIKLVVKKEQLKKLETIVRQVEALEAKVRAVRARMNVIKDLLSARELYPRFMTEILKTFPAGVWITGMTTALSLVQSGGSSITSILGNSFNTVGPGINANSSGSFDTTLNLRGNTFTGGTLGLDAVLSPDGSSGPSSFDLIASGNTFDSLSTAAIRIVGSASGGEDYTHRSTISDNIFTGNGIDYVLNFDGSGASGFIDLGY